MSAASPWLVELSSSAAASHRRCTRFQSMSVRANLASRMAPSTRCVVVFAPAAQLPRARRGDGESAGSPRVLVYADGTVCVVQVESEVDADTMVSEFWPLLEKAFGEAVQGELGGAPPASQDGEVSAPLFSAALQQASLREVEQRLCIRLRRRVVECFRQRAIEDFMHRRACSIVARSVEANLSQIKARLWHPEGALMRRRFGGQGVTDPSNTLQTPLSSQ